MQGTRLTVAWVVRMVENGTTPDEFLIDYKLDQRQVDAALEYARMIEARRDEVIARAAAVLGGQEAAAEWLGRPAIGLAGARPGDLLCSPEGIARVAEYLDRIEAGVYC